LMGRERTGGGSVFRDGGAHQMLRDEGRTRRDSDEDWRRRVVSNAGRRGKLREERGGVSATEGAAGLYRLRATPVSEMDGARRVFTGVEEHSGGIRNAGMGRRAVSTTRGVRRGVAE